MKMNQWKRFIRQSLKLICEASKPNSNVSAPKRMPNMLNIENKKLEVVTAVLFLGISLLICFSGWLSYRNNQEYINAQSRAIKISEQLRVLNLTLITFQDAETGQRGYLLTNNPAYLEPYARATEVANTNLSWLRSVFSNEPQFEHYFDEITRLKDQKIDELAMTISLNGSAKNKRALEIVKSDFGKKTMDRIRVLIGDLVRVKRAELLSVERGAVQRAKHAQRSTFALGGAIASLLVTFYLFLFRDLRERRRLKEESKAVENQDLLTGLHNHRFFDTMLANSLKQAYRDHSQVAIMMIELSTSIDLGPESGVVKKDLLLVDVADQLPKIVGSNHVVSRLQDGRFAILVSPFQERRDLSMLAEDIANKLTFSLLSRTRDQYFSVNIGLASYPHDAQNASELMHCAIQALSIESPNRRSRYHFYNETRDTQPSRMEVLTSGLHGAIERQEFSLRFQPQVDIRTGEIVGAEALIRWTHPELGPISPDEFIPIAEKTGLIIPIGSWTLREACRHASSWNAHGQNLRIAVNVSAIELAGAGFIEAVRSALANAGLRAQDLEIEVTERLLIDENTIQPLDKIRQLGAHISIDDFGTGYSSLSYLARFPVNVLKIDRSFINNIPENSKDCSVVRTIINIGKELGITVVAEGIEHKEQAEFLKRYGCDIGQGYFFCKPVTAPEFEKLAKKE